MIGKGGAPYARRSALLACLILSAWPASGGAQSVAQTYCDGQAVATFEQAPDPRPQVRLAVDGAMRPVLVDTGSTQNALFDDARAQGSAGIQTTTGVAGAPNLFFAFRPNTFAPLGERNGALLGTDMLARAGVVFSASQIEFASKPCRSDRLVAAGFHRVAEKGYFASPTVSRLRGPNVPVLPISIGGMDVAAQIDTGYDDRVFPYSVDINKPMLDALRARGMTLVRVGGVNVGTCAGVESRDVYKGPGALRLGAASDPLAQVVDYVLIPKTANACGGIASQAAPAAQLSARFLDRFAAVALDGPGEAIWVKPK